MGCNEWGSNAELETTMPSRPIKQEWQGFSTCTFTCSTCHVKQFRCNGRVVLMCIRNTEELYSSAKCTPKVGEQYKKCASSPAWPDRASSIQVFCCTTWPKGAQCRWDTAGQHWALTLWESGRLNLCTRENNQLWVNAHYQRPGEGNAVAEIRNL